MYSQGRQEKKHTPVRINLKIYFLPVRVAEEFGLDYLKTKMKVYMESAKSCTVATQPDLWELDETGSFKNDGEMEKCLNTISFLSNLDWVNTHKKQVSLIISLMGRTTPHEKVKGRIKEIGQAGLNAISGKFHQPLGLCPLAKIELLGCETIINSPLKNLYNEYASLQNDQSKINIHKINKNGESIAYQVQKNRLVAMSNLFQRMLSAKENETIEINEEAQLLGEMDRFLTYLESEQHENNIIPMLSLAIKYGIEEISDKCHDDFASILNLESLAKILQIGLSLSDLDLILLGFDFGLTELKKSRQCLDTLTNESESVMKMIEDLKKCASLEVPPEFIRGQIFFEKVPEIGPLFQELIREFPHLTIFIKMKSPDDLEKIPAAFPNMQNLIISFPMFNFERDIQALKKNDSLKTFGSIEGFTFKSSNEIKEYIKQLSPIKLSTLNVGDYRMTDGDLNELSEDLKDLKHLMIRYSKITKIPPSIQPEFLDCSHSQDLETLSLTRVEKLTANYCYGLKKVSALTVKTAQLYECHQVEEIFFPKVLDLSVVHCGLVKVTAFNVKTIACDHEPSLFLHSDPEVKQVWGYPSTKKWLPYQKPTIWEVPLDVKFTGYSS